VRLSKEGYAAVAEAVVAAAQEISRKRPGDSLEISPAKKKPKIDSSKEPNKERGHVNQGRARGRGSLRGWEGGRGGASRMYTDGYEFFHQPGYGRNVSTDARGSGGWRRGRPSRFSGHNRGARFFN
jgi:hypothetical protein